MKKVIVALVVLSMTMFVGGCGGKDVTNETTASVEETETYSEFEWPDSEIAQLLPVPKSNVGEIRVNDWDMFSVYVAGTSEDDYKEYVKACKDAGFTVEFSEGNDYYYAFNDTGYDLSLHYGGYIGDNVMSVHIDVSEESSEVATETGTMDEEPNLETESTEVDASESTEASSTDGIRPEFKEAMDSYEAFFDEYCEFMKKYSESNDSASMLADYTDYMTQYAETMEKMNDIGNEELSDEELLYYTEVTSRITQKLLEVNQ